jgi:hypothetical protein
MKIKLVTVTPKKKLEQLTTVPNIDVFPPSSCFSPPPPLDFGDDRLMTEFELGDCKLGSFKEYKLY